jgi:hypothetical protein
MVPSWECELRNLGKSESRDVRDVDTPSCDQGLQDAARCEVARRTDHLWQRLARVTAARLFPCSVTPFLRVPCCPFVSRSLCSGMPINGGSGWLQSMISPERLAGNAKCKIPTSPGGAACRIERFGVQNAAFSVPELACF